MKALLLAATAAALLAGSASAQDRQPQNLDTNHDSKVTWDEFQAMQAGRTARMFERNDADHDGKITQAEMDAARAARAKGAPAQSNGPGEGGGRGGRMLAMMDADHDGAVTKAEMEAASKARFDAADSNHDGWLSKDELSLLRPRMGGPRPQG